MGGEMILSRAMLTGLAIVGVVAEVVDPIVDPTAAPGPAQDTLAEDPLDHAGEEGEDVDPHDVVSIRARRAA